MITQPRTHTCEPTGTGGRTQMADLKNLLPNFELHPLQRPPIPPSSYSHARRLLVGLRELRNLFSLHNCLYHPLGLEKYLYMVARMLQEN